MLSSLVILGSVLAGRIQNPQFPKPGSPVPVALQDNTVFKYLTQEDKKNSWKPLEVGRDWSSLGVPEIKPDALKLKVLLAVAERDFSNQEYSNTFEMRDKTRLLEAMGHLKSLFAIVSDGSIKLEFVPRFVQEPIFDLREFKQLINAEFNSSKFESDDSVERGPFAAVIALSSSHVEDQPEPGVNFAVHGFADLGGSSQDMWFEEGLFYVVQSAIANRLNHHLDGLNSVTTIQESRTLLMDRLWHMRGEFQRLFDPITRQDGDLVTKWSQQSFRELGRPFRLPEMAAVQSPASLSVADGVLNYSELSIMRAGEFALPASSKWGASKSLKFEVKSSNQSPVGLKLWMKDGSKKESLIDGRVLTADNTWKSVTVSLNSDVIGASIGAPSTTYGRSRPRPELTQCDFRNFELTNEESTNSIPGPLPISNIDTESAIKEVLTNGNKTAKRKALANIDQIKSMRGLESVLLAATGDLDAGVSHDATRAYFEFVLSGQPTADQLTTLGKFLIASPNDSSREVALSYVAKNPSFAKFDSVIGNTVSGNWRVRRTAALAMGALSKANIKEKEGCHQMLLTSTGQEMALIRLSAISQLDPSQKSDSQRLEFLMINDPCESVRLACLRILASSTGIPKEKLFGCLADDSPTLRERIPVAFGAKHPLLREVLQRMVVDQDPYVRLSAIQNFAAIGDVKAGEIQNAFTDKHPAVQMAILKGAKSGLWKIPTDALSKLKDSSIPTIKSMAMEIN
jgi:HEAT repeat protein